LRKSQCGFTLIDLLVVVAIIAILVAIFWSVFAKARQKAQHTSCLSNLKQISNGLLEYVQDEDNHLPPGPGAPWSKLSQYLKSDLLFYCPSDKRKWREENLPLSYGFRKEALEAYLSANPPLQTKDFPIITDYMGTSGIWTLDPDSQNYILTQKDDKYANIALRHLEGCNLAFLDGHAKWAGIEDLKKNLSDKGPWGARSLPSIPAAQTAVVGKVKYEVVPTGPDKVVIKANGKPVAEVTIKLK